MKKEAVVVIPAYKDELSATEKISVQQAYRILNAYDICFMAPEKLRHVLENKGLRGEYFPDACFESIAAYSRLLLDKKFYERFSDYEYMLLYQMDAFVFSDRLHEFCQLGYDYIGAPVHRIYGWPYNLSTVGNGGFSLRKISSCIDVLERKNEIYSELSRNKVKLLENAEDRFFTYCGVHSEISFKLPPHNIALEFAFEHQIRKKQLKIDSENLPFGCHAWSKPYLYHYWRKCIEDCGYDVKEVDLQCKDQNDIDYFTSLISPYLIKRLIRPKNSESCKTLKNYLPDFSGAILWGLGTIGERAQRLFEQIGWEISIILDKGAVEKRRTQNGIIVRKPNKFILTEENKVIIISTDKYSEEISEKLMSYGLVAGKSFFLYSRDLETKIVRLYFEKCCIKWLGRKIYALN